ncbi:MAG: hypothetical protein LQ348_002503 [Seirophora lacunosa]|nr:MAG: hypothetical protein LQ348_002503 [Seirophora lacunosa]
MPVNRESRSQDTESRRIPLEEGSTQSALSTVAKGRSLFVHSLPASVTTEALTRLFSQSYPLKHATVVYNPASNVSKGYGFVTFADHSDALAALETFDGTLFEGRKIKIEIAEPRSRTLQPNDAATRIVTPLSSSAHDKARSHRGRQRLPVEPPPQLIVRNLPWSVSKPEQLAMLFRSYGKVKKATMPKKGPGLSAGFGFVLLRGRKNAEKALTELNGRIMDGRPLAVDWAIQKSVWESLHQNTANGLEEQDESTYHQDEGSEAFDRGSDDSVGVKELQQEEEGGIDRTSSEVGSEDGSPSRTAFANDGSQEDHSSTLFIRNLPFTVMDESLGQHFTPFGNLRYARVVVDPSTGRSKGTGFVCFANKDDAIACLRAAPKTGATATYRDNMHRAVSAQNNRKSILEDVDVDSSGQYTMDGRLLNLSLAVDKSEATRLTHASHTSREVRDRDRRRLYLLSEGTVSNSKALYAKLSPSEIALREESARQRQSLIKTNPALHLSLTRLSVRNLPRTITSKDLKALAREAVVGFSQDVKAGLRQPLSKEELSRAGEVMREAERARKAKGKGIVKQAKVVFEGHEGGKVAESSGAGRSKGYGFVEYTSHRWALMGLRWLNGHAAAAEPNSTSKAAITPERKKRLIVEFAIENAQVVGRRQERQKQSQDKRKIVEPESSTHRRDAKNLRFSNDNKSSPVAVLAAKRKRAVEQHSGSSSVALPDDHGGETEAMERAAKKQKIIGRKRMARKTRKSN